jgi:hypothetical protein
MDHKVITQQGCTKGPYMMGTSCSKTIKNHQKPSKTLIHLNVSYHPGIWGHPGQWKADSFGPGHARVIPGISDLSIFTSEDFEVLWALAAIARRRGWVAFTLGGRLCLYKV